MSQKIRDNVKRLVAVRPEVKDNYNLLVMQYWRVFERAKNWNDVVSCTPAESITRAFRKLVSDGVIEVSTKTKLLRDKMEVEFREEYSPKG